MSRDRGIPLIHRELWEGSIHVIIFTLELCYFLIFQFLLTIPNVTSFQGLILKRAFSQETVAPDNKPKGKPTKPQIWVYDINSLSLVKGAPFKNKSICGSTLGINRHSVANYLDTEKVFNNKWIFSSSILSKEELSSPAPPASSVPSLPESQVPASSIPSPKSLPEPTVPDKIYPNSDTCKTKILSDNKNKSGIYMWKNSINGKRYIGSSENLNRRFKEYFNINYLLKNNSMYICNSLIKHGYSNFSLIILEYCSPSKCLIREKHYWDLFNPEYNLAKDPTAPFSGRKHSDKTKTKMSDALTGENHPNYGKTHSDETKTIMSEAKKGKPRVEGAGKPSQKVEVFDKKTNKTTTYNSISEAARALNLSNHKIITNYILRNQKKLYKGIYFFKKV